MVLIHNKEIGDLPLNSSFHENNVLQARDQSSRLSCLHFAWQSMIPEKTKVKQCKMKQTCPLNSTSYMYLCKYLYYAIIWYKPERCMVWAWILNSYRHHLHWQSYVVRDSLPEEFSSCNKMPRYTWVYPGSDLGNRFVILVIIIICIKDD